MRSRLRLRSALGWSAGCARGIFLLLSVYATSAGAGAPGHAAGPAPGSSGSIVITDHLLNPAMSSFQKDIKTEGKASLPKNPDSETWKVFFVAWLNKAPNADDVNIVFYEPGPAKPGQAREPVQAYPIHTKSSAKILMSQIDLKPEDGFKAGGKYQVLITRLINGKEDVYARTTLELTDKGADKGADKGTDKGTDKGADKGLEKTPDKESK